MSRSRKRHSPPDGDRFGLPPIFLERMAHLLGDEFSAFEASLGQPAAAGLRVNTLKISLQDFQALSPYPLAPVPWCPDGFQLPPDQTQGATAFPPGQNPYHAAGLYYLQEPSAMAAVELLDPQPGERILDLSAAPGGKSTHIAARLKGEGLLLANEIHPRRAWELAQNLERWGAVNVAITQETPLRLAEHLPAGFDRVLLDAPCSGEGMFRKSAPARQAWSPDLVQSCARRQSAILETAARLVRPGGRLVYATCTFSPEENEAVILDFLEQSNPFELTAPPALLGTDPGRPDWVHPPGDGGPHLEQARRLWPHRSVGDGHFVAVLQHTGKSRTTQWRPWKPSPAPIASREGLARFLHTAELPPGVLYQQGTYLYLLPPQLPELGDLKIIHPGLWLGTIKSERFEPAHALALAAWPQPAWTQPAWQTIPLALPEALRYLRGEPMPCAAPDGWGVVTLDGFALGWGKMSGGTLKNFYPKGLRFR